MIRSQNKTFGFWLLAGAMIFFSLLIVCCITQYYFGIIIIKIGITGQKSFNGHIIIDTIAILIFGSILSFNANTIIIENDGHLIKGISFKNFFSRSMKTYPFDELDGYITTSLNHKQWKENKTICLIKDRRVIKKIDNFFYSNIDEIQNGLAGLKYFGYKDWSIIKSFKTFFNQPILND